MSTGLTINLGDTAVIKVVGVQIVLASNRAQNYDRQFYSAFAIESAVQQLLCIKSVQHFPADYGPIASGQQPDQQEVTVKASETSYQFREFYQLWQSDGGPWVEAIDWSAGEDPRTSALQRQLTELDKWSHGKPNKLATAQEVLAV